MYWNELTEALKADARYPQLKSTLLAQWALESGWGGSWLAKNAYNYGGLKWRADIKLDDLDKVHYDEGRGEEDKTYCKLKSAKHFIECYYAFLARSPYKGWESHTATGEDFISFIVNAGYVGGSDAHRKQYIDKVLALREKTAPLVTPDDKVARWVLDLKGGLVGYSADDKIVKSVTTDKSNTELLIECLKSAPKAPYSISATEVPQPDKPGENDDEGPSDPDVDRPNQNQYNAKALWYPLAAITDTKMRTRGYYPDRYPKGAVVHYTAGRSLDGDANATGTIAYGAKQGYAYMTIANTGKVFQAHSLSSWGYHAGKSSWSGLGSGVSQYLVGIEICCAGRLTKIGDGLYQSWFKENYTGNLVRGSKDNANIVQGYYHKYTSAQEEALIDLLIWLKWNNPSVFNFDYVVGHDEVSPGRKQDPGASLSMNMPTFRQLLKERWDAIT